MDRFTKEDISQEGYDLDNCSCLGNYRPSTCIPDCIDKLGEIEDLLEKYNVHNVEYLERCIVDHDKYGELQEQLGCPLDVYVKLITKKVITIYDKSGERCMINNIDGNIINVFKKFKGSYTLKVNHYKQDWFLKEDRSEQICHGGLFY